MCLMKLCNLFLGNLQICKAKLNDCFVYFSSGFLFVKRKNEKEGK